MHALSWTVIKRNIFYSSIALMKGNASLLNNRNPCGATDHDEAVGWGWAKLKIWSVHVIYFVNNCSNSFSDSQIHPWFSLFFCLLHLLNYIWRTSLVDECMFLCVWNYYSMREKGIAFPKVRVIQIQRLQCKLRGYGFYTGHPRKVGFWIFTPCL